MYSRQLPYQRAEHHKPISGKERFTVANVHLHLTRCIFRVRLLDRDARLVDLLADWAKHVLQFGGASQ